MSARHFFAEISLLRPSQHRISSKSVAERLAKAEKRGDLVQNPTQSTYALPFDSGRSLYPINKAISVIQYDSSYIVHDGHHSICASLKVGATTFPIWVTQDYSALNEQDLWNELECLGFAYHINLGGQKALPPKDFSELQEDPFRYFAECAARKYDEDLLHEKSRGAENPLWIKIGKDIPFIEFILADHLRKYGFSFDYSDPMDQAIINASQILEMHPLEGLKYVRNRSKFNENPEIDAYLNNYNTSSKETFPEPRGNALG